MTTNLRPHEAIIARHLIQTTIERGHHLSVWDGGEWTVVNSQDAAEVFAALGSTDEDQVRIRATTAGALLTAQLIYGNEPGVLIADYWTAANADQGEVEELMGIVGEVADAMDRIAQEAGDEADGWSEEEWQARLAPVVA